MAELKPGWQRVKFGELAECINDRVDDPATAGVDRYVGLEHLDPDTLTIRRWGSPTDVESTKLRFQPGDIIFGKRRAYQRKLAVADFEGICSAHAMVLRARAEIVLPEFLPFFMQGDLFMRRAVKISVGSLSPTINWKTLAQQEFVLPPLDEQRKISELLEASSATVDALEDAVSASRSLEASLFEGRLAGFSVTCNEVAAIDILDRLTVGIVVKPASWYTSDGTGVPALRSLNVAPGLVLTEDLVRLTPAGHDLHRKSRLSPGDVVIVRTGRPGEAAVIPEGLGELNCIDLIVASPGKKLNPYYLEAYLNSIPGKRAIASCTAGTAQQHFNVSALKALRLPLPPLREQDALVNELSRARIASSSVVNQLKRQQMLSQLILAELCRA